MYSGEHGERSGGHFLWYLEGLTSTGVYKTIKSQNYCFLRGGGGGGGGGRVEVKS